MSGTCSWPAGCFLLVRPWLASIHPLLLHYSRARPFGPGLRHRSPGSTALVKTWADGARGVTNSEWDLWWQKWLTVRKGCKEFNVGGLERRKSTSHRRAQSQLSDSAPPTGGDPAELQPPETGTTGLRLIVFFALPTAPDQNTWAVNGATLQRGGGKGEIVVRPSWKDWGPEEGESSLELLVTSRGIIFIRLACKLRECGAINSRSPNFLLHI